MATKSINSIPDDVVITPQMLREVLPISERQSQRLVLKVKTDLSIGFVTYGVAKRHLGIK